MSRRTNNSEAKRRALSFEQECIELFSEFLHVLGVPKSVGQIYGLLFASPEPLCFGDIVERLNASKGSVSQGLSFLRQSGAILTIERPDDRREFFEPELGLRRLASGVIREKILPLAEETQASFQRLHQSTSASPAALKQFQLSRIEQLRTWHRQLRRVMPVVLAILSVPRK